MALHVESMNVQYDLGSKNSICSERSTPSPDSGLDFNRSQSSEFNFLQLRCEDRQIKRKISTSSEASYVSTSLSYDGGYSDRPITPDELIQCSNKYDYIIDKIGDLTVSPSGSSLNLNNSEISYDIFNEEKGAVEEGDDESDDELQERGPEPRNKHIRQRPYENVEERNTSVSAEPQGYLLECAAHQIFNTDRYRDIMTTCIDQCLTDHNGEQGNCLSNEWLGNNMDSGSVSTHSKERSLTNIPSIRVNEEVPSDEDHEDQLLKLIRFQKCQSAQSDISNSNASPAPSSENWPDSPTSSYNVLSSRPDSRPSSTSSHPHSPGSSGNMGSPLLSNFIAGSPPQQRLTQFRQPRPQSTSSSSNHSYGDIPSPSNYLYTVDRRTEDQLEMNFGNVTCFGSWDSSVDAMNSRIQPKTEAINNREQDEMQVVPKFRCDSMTCRMPDSTSNGNKQNIPHEMELNTNLSELVDTGILINSVLIDNDYNYDNYDPNFTNFDNILDFDQEISNIVGSNYNSQNTTSPQMYLNKTPELHNIHDPGPSYNIQDDRQQKPVQQNCEFPQYDNNEKPSTSSFHNFTIPKPVSQYNASNSRRNSDIWQSLNLPDTPASEALKAKVDAREVQKAMKSLLKKSNHELTKQDEDGDTMLMCLVGNASELRAKLAFLPPLVERIAQIYGGLTITNNRDENALYLAAMNCPDMPYVAGYLAAVMLQKGIDISQELYQTQGNTLIHAVSTHGESHKSVLAELLRLKNPQGNPVFELSKCNYDGKTPLHVAVESHNPSGSGNNSISIVKLLLEHGADPKVKDAMCGNTALHLAVSLSGDPSLIKTLLTRRGCDAVNVSNNSRNTPLHMAAAMSGGTSLDVQMDICMNLIKAGASTNLLNAQGRTPLALVSAERKEFIRNIFHKKS